MPERILASFDGAHIIGAGLIILCALLCDKAWAQHEVMDDLGNVVHLAKPANKIVSLAPHLTELIFSAKAHDKLVGVSRHCDYPPAVESIRVVSDYQTIDFEALALLKPDLVLVWNAGLRARQLERIKVWSEAVYISAPASFADIAQNLRDIGTLAGTTRIAHKAADIFIHKIQILRTRYASLPKVPVVYLLWADPPMTVTKAHWIDTAIQLCGGHNRYAEMPGETIVLQHEDLRLHPDSLILYSVKNPGERSKLPRSAVYFPGDALQRPSLRIADASTQLCQVLMDHRP